jgi:hypothetical protein
MSDAWPVLGGSYVPLYIEERKGVMHMATSDLLKNHRKTASFRLSVLLVANLLGTVAYLLKLFTA